MNRSQSDIVCPSSITLGGDAFPINYGSYYSEAYTQGSKRGQRLTMRGPWTLNCGGSRPQINLPEISFDVGNEGNTIITIGTYANPCNANYPLRVTSQQSSVEYGVGRNFSFEIYFAG